MTWLLELWTSFSMWLDHLSGRQAAVLGAAALLIAGGLGKYVVVPLGGWALGKLGAHLYPLVSGAVFLDRFVALPRYLENVAHTVSRLRNPWLQEGQKLHDIFVPVAITSGQAAGQRLDLRQLFRGFQAAVIVGDPGSGKTTGLKSIAVDCLHRRHLDARGRPFIPVYLSLREWAAADLPLADYLVVVFKQNGFPRPARLLRRMRDAGRLVLLLDGLDEVDDLQRGTIIRRIREVLTEEKQTATGCRVYITSRPVAYQGQLHEAIDETVYMVDFTPAQIQTFLQNWDFRPPKSPEKLFQTLVARAPILSICRNPLMLTIVTSLYRETDYQLPDSRDEFYRVCIEALLKRWDAVKDLDDRNKYAIGLKEAFLREFAFESLAQEGADMSDSWVLSRVEAFLNQRQQREVRADAFLAEIVRSGLIGRLPTGINFFAHKTFAEALAAAYVHNKPAELVARWIGKPDTWLEVCSLFVADPRTPVGDIAVLLGNAKERHDWRGLLTLAGEAHTCPEPYLTWIPATVLDRVDVWDRLDRRSVAALARLGDSVRPLLTRMVGEGAIQTQQQAIYALGQTQSEWAVNLLVESLTHDTTRNAAAEALAGLGDDALVIMKDIIQLNPDDEAVVRPCIKVATTIGSAAAFQLVVPLIWGRTYGVWRDATVLVASMLSKAEHRASFEAIRSGPSRRDDEVVKLEEWAAPRSQHEASRAHFAKLVLNVSRLIEDDKINPEDIEDAPLDLIIPSLIAAGNSAERWVASSSAATTDPVTKLKFPSPVEAIRLSREVTGEDVPRRFGTVLGVLAARDDNANRDLWSRAVGPNKRDIVLTQRIAFTVGMFLLVSTHAPLVAGVARGVVSYWWFVPILIFYGLTIAMALSDRDRDMLMIPAFVFYSPTMLWEDVKKKTVDRSVPQVFLGISMILLIGPALAAYRLGALWPLCLAGPVLINLARWDSSITPPGLLLWRRNNPLLTLCPDERASDGIN